MTFEQFFGFCLFLLHYGNDPKDQIQHSEVDVDDGVCQSEGGHPFKSGGDSSLNALFDHGEIHEEEEACNDEVYDG